MRLGRFHFPTLVALACLALLPLQAAAQVPNDQFANAEVLSSSATGTVRGSSVGSSAEAGERPHWTGNPAARSVWYRWVAPSGGRVTMNTRGSDFDTLLAVYTGSAVNALVSVASNDDGGNDLGVQSLVTFTATAGTTYRIAVDGYGGGFGAVQLNWSLSGPPTISRQPVDTEAVEGGTAGFSVAAESAVAMTFQWYRGTNAIVGARSNVLAFGPVTLADGGVPFVVTAGNVFGSVTSAPALLRVTPDRLPPAVVQAYNRGRTNLVVVFDEGLRADSVSAAGAFRLGSGVDVVAGRLESDGRTVVLHTTPMEIDREYELQVQGVTDAAGQPNPVPAGTRFRFLTAELSIAAVGVGGVDGQLVHPSPGTWGLSGVGSGISGGLDQFQYASAERTGDFDVQVRVASLGVVSAGMQAGLMARVDGSPGAAFAGVFAATPQLGSFFESRGFPGVNTTVSTAGSGFPSVVPEGWLRLRRETNTFTGYASLDGRSWVRLGSATLEAPPTLLLGLALSAEAGGRVATALFSGLGDTRSQEVVPWADPAFREPLGISSRRTGVVVSEVRYSGRRDEGTNAVEFIELYNAGAVFEELGGWQLEGEVRHRFAPGTVLEPGAFLVLAGDAAAFAQRHGFAPAGTFEGRLNSGGGLVRLRDENRAIRLEFEYDDRAPWPEAGSDTGHSIVLARPSFGEADPLAWSASAREGGSPGFDDPWLRPGPSAVRIDELLPRPGPGATPFVELSNLSGAEADLSGAVLTDDPSVRRHVFPGGTRVPAGGRLVLDGSALGVGLSPAGGRLFLLDAASNAVHVVRYGALPAGVSFGRAADGADLLRPLASPTPGQPNSGPRLGRIVINEVQYRPISGDDNDQFVEIHNRGGQRVDLAGWAFTDGIEFTFPTVVSINPGGYLVVARNADRLMRSHPALETRLVLGNWQGSLRGSGERLALSYPEVVTVPAPGGGTTNRTVWIEEDAMVWGDGGRWPELADGGGSTLERVDPAGDPFRPSTWAASDERDKAPWTTFEVTGILDQGTSQYGFNQVQLTLQGAGECLVDGVEVLLGTASYQTNGGFEAGTLPNASGWVFQGNHLSSFIEEGGAWAGRRSLHLVAPGRGDTGINRVRGLLRAGLHEGARVTLRARARWLAGWPEVLLRLRGNWLELPMRLEIPRNLGTPGRANSRRVPNAGPAVFEVSHFPVLPVVGEAAFVTARASDPDGIGSLAAVFRADPSTNLTRVPMNDLGVEGDAVAGDGLWTARIPERQTPGLVAFRVEAADALGGTSVFPANAPVGEALIRWGDPRPFGTLGHFHLWNTSANAVARGSQMNNTYRDCTVVHNGVRVVYNAGFKDKGSPFHSGGGDFLVAFPRDQRLLGSDSMVAASTGNGGSEDTHQREQMSFWIGRKLGTPWLNRRYIRFYRNGSAPRPVMEDSEEPDGDFTEYWYGEAGDGELFKIEDWFEFDDSGTGFVNTDARLEPYFTDDGLHKTARYRWSWRKRAVDRTANDYTSLFQLAAMGQLPDFANRIPALIDAENWARVLVQERICGNWDSFGMSRGKNMYAYKPAAGKWRLIPWDIDFTLGTGNPPEDGLMFGGDPTVNQLFGTPFFHRMVYRAYREAVDGPLNPAQFEAQLSARTNVLRANGIVPASNRSIADYMNRRRNTILTQLNAVDVPALSIATPAVSTNSSESMVLQGAAPLGAVSIRVNGNPVEPTWSTARDFLLSVDLPVRTNEFEIAAFDRSGNPVAGSPRLVTVHRPSAPVSVPGTVRINEVVASNAAGNTDPADGSVDEDWIELHNPGSETVTLAGWRISDREAFSGAYVIPAGFRIPAGGYLLVWADNEVSQNRPGGDLHVPFRLSNEGERVLVFDPSGAVVDRLDFGALGANQAFGRYPDASTNLALLRAGTPRADNSGVGGPNRPPVLPVLPARTLVAGQRLDLLVLADDPDNDRFTLRLGLDAPAGTRIEEGTRLRWVPSASNAGVHTFHLELTDAGIPALTTAQEITVTVLAPEVPALQTVNSNGQLRVRWASQSGVRFRVEQTDDLVSGRWILVDEVVGTGSPLEVALPAESSARWFRVRIL